MTAHEALPANSIKTHAARAGLVFLAMPLLLLLAVPLLALVQQWSNTSMAQALTQPETQQAILLTVKTSLIATALVIVLGTPVAYYLGRSRSRGARLLSVLIDLPTILPPAVAGLALLLAFGRMGFAGRWLAQLGIEVVFTQTAVVLAQVFVAAPYYIKSASVGIAAVPRELDDAAAIDGASLLQKMRYITLPVAFGSLVTGTALCLARAMGEFGATIFFAGNIPGRTQTMPLAIYIGFQSELDQAIALSLLLLFLSFGVLFCVHALQARREAA